MRDCAERKNILPIAADSVGTGSILPGETHILKWISVGATPRGRPNQCASVTLDPMRDCAEWKNILPKAADSVGAS